MERSIAQLSGGEKKRVALALGLGFAEVVAARGRLTSNILVLDEVRQLGGGCGCVFVLSTVCTGHTVGVECAWHCKPLGWRCFKQVAWFARALWFFRSSIQGAVQPCVTVVVLLPNGAAGVGEAR